MRSLAAFRIFDQGDRVGRTIFGDDSLAEIRPARSQASLTALLTALADANGMLRAHAAPVAPMPLNRVLDSVARIARRNHLILVFSDFDEVDETTHRLIAGLSRHNDVVLGLVSDPFAEDMPKGRRVVVSDGELQAEINTGDTATHGRLQDISRGRLARILHWQRQLGVPVLPVTTAEDSISQMRRSMGLLGQRR